GDFPGELAKLRSATGDGELARWAFHDTFDELYG
ncbi:MAG: hypothetical protein QOF38_311, partial [Pseudonocardiales bacterium]|nr:hypothetical protein [Pseudonocardiales bacterium]